jgi:hypothetical protein
VAGIGADVPRRKGGGMDEDMKRRLLFGVLSLVLSVLATRVALYITNKILGEPELEA